MCARMVSAGRLSSKGQGRGPRIIPLFIQAIPPRNLVQDSLERSLFGAAGIARPAGLCIAACLPPADAFEDCFNVGMKARSLFRRVSKVEQKRADLQREYGELNEPVVFLEERHQVLIRHATSCGFQPAFRFPGPYPARADLKHPGKLIDGKGTASQFLNRMAEPVKFWQSKR